MQALKASRGFTLIEMIISLVILGILSLAITGYLQFGAETYISTIGREKLQSESRFLMERIARELRHAAPNSVAEQNLGGMECLSFYPVSLSASYFDKPLSTDTEIAFLPSLPSDAKTEWMKGTKNLGLAIGYSNIVQYQRINNTFPLQVTSDTSVEQDIYTLNYQGSVTAQSPAKRMYLYRDKVSLCLSAANVGGYQSMYRITNEDMMIDLDQVVLSTRITGHQFDVQGAGLNNNGIAHISMTFDFNGEQSTYNHSVQVLNVL